jgi:hypothetical protein
MTQKRIDSSRPVTEEHDGRVIAIAALFVRFLFDFFKPRQRLEAEILVLRHQLNILQQRAPRRLHSAGQTAPSSFGSIAAFLAFLMP